MDNIVVKIYQYLALIIIKPDLNHANYKGKRARERDN